MYDTMCFLFVVAIVLVLFSHACTGMYDINERKKICSGCWVSTVVKRSNIHQRTCPHHASKPSIPPFCDRMLSMYHNPTSFMLCDPSRSPNHVKVRERMKQGIPPESAEEYLLRVRCARVAFGSRINSPSLRCFPDPPSFG